MNGFISKLRSYDWMLFIALSGILLLSFTALYSIGLGREGASFSERQAGALLVGMVGMVVFSLLNYRLLKNAAIPFYMISILLLLIVLFFGERVRGTRGWFFIGEFGFQPVEFAKLGLILCLARYFSFWTRHVGRLKPVMISALLAGIPVVLILLQPDFGSAIIVCALWFFMALVRGIPKRILVGIGIFSFIFFITAWFFAFQDYQKERIQSFLFPQADISGAGYNVRQALIAIGTGQLTGMGIGAGSGSQLRFLPEAQTDFIFAVIAEELGFIGVSALLLFWLLFFYRLLRMLRRAYDDFAAFIVFGALTVFFLHFIINIGGNLGLIPITGLVLPFVSYGGSSLAVSLVLVGIIQSIAIHAGEVRVSGVDRSMKIH